MKISSRPIALIVQGLLALVVVPIFSFLNAQLGPEQAITLECVYLTLLLVWCLASWWNVCGRLMDPYSAFLLSAFCFNAGQCLLQMFGANPHGLLGGRFSPSTLQETITVVALGLTALHFGAMAATVPRATPVSTTATPDRDRALRLVGWVLLAIGIAPCVMTLREDFATSISSGYLALFQREYATGLGGASRLLADLTVPAALYALAGARERRSQRVVIMCLILAIAVVKLLIGYRSTALMILFAGAWLWHRAVRPIRRVEVIVGIAIVLVVLPALRVLRDASGPEKYTARAISEVYGSIDNPLTSVLSEMGSSMSTVAYTIELVPAERRFEYGLTYVDAVFTIVPNLFWSVHPTVASGRASDWLVWRAEPAVAAQHGGLGYSFIAEAYLNFGPFGVPIVLCIFGYWLARYVSGAHRANDPAQLAMLAAFALFILRFPRDESAGICRNLVWYAWLPYFLVSVLPSWRTRIEGARGTRLTARQPLRAAASQDR